MDAMEYQRGWEIILEELCRQHNVYPEKKHETKCGGYGCCHTCANSYYEYGTLECRKDYMYEKYDMGGVEIEDADGLEEGMYCKYYEEYPDELK